MKHWLLAAALICLGSVARADHETVTAADRGTYVDIATVSGSSTAGTAFASANRKRMDGVYFNNTSTVVWLGTTTATLNNVLHSNILNGLPVLASSTFRLDGKMTGDVYFTCNATVSACEIRSLEGLNR